MTPTLPKLPFAVFDEFGNGADDRVMDYGEQCARAAVPAGFVLVPKEPTKEMEQAAMPAWLTRKPFSEVYRCMLSAAPAAPQAEPEQRTREKIEQLKFDIRQAMIEYGSAYKAGHDGGIKEASERGCRLIDELAAAALGRAVAEPGWFSVKLAEMILSDCGHSSEYTPLLNRVAARIEKHVEEILSAAQPPTQQASRVGEEGWRNLAETQAALIKTIGRINEIERQYGLQDGEDSQQASAQGEQAEPDRLNLPRCKECKTPSACRAHDTCIAAPANAPMDLAIEALLSARAGLEWYRDQCAANVDGSDDEADDLIDRALTALRDSKGDQK